MMQPDDSSTWEPTKAGMTNHQGLCYPVISGILLVKISIYRKSTQQLGGCTGCYFVQHVLKKLKPAAAREREKELRERKCMVCVCVCVHASVHALCVCVCARWRREQGVCQYSSSSSTDGCVVCTWLVPVIVWPVSMNHFHHLTDVTQVWIMSSVITEPQPTAMTKEIMVRFFVLKLPKKWATKGQSPSFRVQSFSTKVFSLVDTQKM